jgi:hypothetical protein
VPIKLEAVGSTFTPSKSRWILLDIKSQKRALPREIIGHVKLMKLFFALGYETFWLVIHQFPKILMLESLIRKKVEKGVI